jgi:catechol 2,3-dioxygenase-like lactoylglutathione lyase family enzyme
VRSACPASSHDGLPTGAGTRARLGRGGLDAPRSNAMTFATRRAVTRRRRDERPRRILTRSPLLVDALQADAEAAAHFYSELFGWELSDQTPRDSRVRYFVCKLRGRDVAAVGSRPSEGVPPDWNTYIWVGGGRSGRRGVRRVATACTRRRPGRQRAGRVGDVGARHSRSRALRALLRCGVGVGKGDIRVAVMAPRSGDGSPDDITAHWSVNFWVDDADAVSATAEGARWCGCDSPSRLGT